MAQIILDSNNNLIQGDFDNATLNNRTKLQTTTTNATTNVYVAPNGSATSAGVSVANNSSLTNASKIVMATNGTTDTQIISGVNGSGSYLPMSFYTNNALGMQLSTAGNLTVTGSISAASGLGGATTLGTVSATSGTSVTLSGLTLTSYKFLILVMNGVSTASAANIVVNGITTTSVFYAPAANYNGIQWLDLSTGIVNAAGGNYNAEKSTLTTASTSITFTTSGGIAYTGTGSFKVYGVS
jgi:hypothetical protein